MSDNARVFLCELDATFCAMYNRATRNVEFFYTSYKPEMEPAALKSFPAHWLHKVWMTLLEREGKTK